MNKTIGSDFDGHLEFRLRDLSTVDKLRYMSMQIELHHYIRTHVHKSTPEKRDGARPKNLTSHPPFPVRTPKNEH